MRVVYLAPFDLREPAGHTSHVLATVRQMTAKGHEVVLLARGLGVEEMEDARFVPVGSLERPGFQAVSFGVAGSAALRRELARTRPDVLYTRYFKTCSLPLLMARLFAVPGIVEVNSHLGNERRANRRGPIAVRVEEAEERLIYSISKGVIAVSAAVAEHVASIQEGARRKLSIIENGVDNSVYRPLDRDSCVIKHGLDPSRKRVVFAGGFQVWQGLQDLVAAMGILCNARPDIDLLLVGDGPLRNTIQRATLDHRIEHRVVFKGSVSEAIVAELICASNICVAPYNLKVLNSPEPPGDGKGAEMRGSPLKIYSYLACGRPVVATHFREAGAYLEANKVGLAVPPENPVALARAIEVLLDNPAMARDMGMRGRRLVEERHDWSRVVDRYLEVAEGLLLARSR